MDRLLVPVATSSAITTTTTAECSSGPVEPQVFEENEDENTMLIEEDDNEAYHFHHVSSSYSYDSFISRSWGGSDDDDERGKEREHIGEIWDPIAMISTISEAYRRGIYMKMITLDREAWEPFGHGGTFQVSRSTIDIEVVSSRNNRRKETVSNRLVLKRVFHFREHAPVLAATDIRSFIGELRVLDHLHGHPFVVDLRGIGWFNSLRDFDASSSPSPALLLEEATNTLEYLVGPDVSVSFEAKLAILAQIGCALGALHSSGVAHGDVKPANVLLFQRETTREGVLVRTWVAKLSDFGSAVFAIDGVRHSVPRGSSGYTAPEVDVAGETGEESMAFEAVLRTDVWSFGMLAAELIRGSGWRAVHDVEAHMSPDLRVQRILSSINRQLEDSVAEAAVVQDIRSVFAFSLTVNSDVRDLGRMMETLAKYHLDAGWQRCVCSSLSVLYRQSHIDKLLASNIRVRCKALWRLA